MITPFAAPEPYNDVTMHLLRQKYLNFIGFIPVISPIIGKPSTTYKGSLPALRKPDL